MRARILNDSGYHGGFPSVKFPVEVEASLDPRYPQFLFVHKDELLRIGGCPAWEHFGETLGSPMAAFLIGSEAEVVS